MKNKLLFSSIVSLLLLSLAACADSNGSNTNSQEQQPAEETPESVPEEESPSAKDDNPKSPEAVPGDSESNKQNNDDPINNILKDIEDLSVITLVNKQYSLTEDDIPNDLVTVDVPTILDNPEVNQLRKVAADALKLMFEDAKESGVILYARSGYRSYNTQVQLFENYTARNGEEEANRYSARAGQSEHQTGLVMDVTAESANYQLIRNFDETVEGAWIRDHAHESGFIVRYPKDMEHITGYIYEPWHLRYLGVDMATNVYESGLTYEEYLESEGILHEVSAQ